MRGFGTVVTGTLVSGTVQADEALDRAAAGDGRTTVRGLHVHGQPREAAAAGERVAMNLAGLDVDAVPRGAVLAAPGAFLPTRRVDAELTLLPGAAPLKHGARVRVHQGTAEVLARVSIAGAAGAVAAGATALVRLRLERPAVLTRGDRFIVRTYSPLVTIGGGVVLDPDPPRVGLRAARAVARLEALRVRPDLAADVAAAASRMVADAGLAGTSVARLAARLGRPAAEVRAALAALETAGSIVAAGDWAVDRTSAHQGHRGHARRHRRVPPRAAAGRRSSARGGAHALVRSAPSAVFERLVAELAAAGRVVARDTIAAAGHRLVAHATRKPTWRIGSRPGCVKPASSRPTWRRSRPSGAGRRPSSIAWCSCWSSSGGWCGSTRWCSIRRCSNG